MADQAANGCYFTIKQLKNGEYVASFRNPDGTAVFWTESFTSFRSAQNAIESIRMRGPSAPVRDTTLESDPRD